MAKGRTSVTVDTIMFHGIAFHRYPDSPRASDRMYYRPNARHITRGVKSLHCEIWEAAHGPIPPGWEVHHRDGDALNNDLDNLECLEAGAHRRYHAEHRPEAERARARAHLDQVRPLAAAWHRSEAGREWHQQHMTQVWAAKTPQAFVCAHCGREATSLLAVKARYCSNACKAAARRRAGTDTVERACRHCGKSFTVNRYATTQTCSRRCAALLRWARRKAA
jgi:HNH endonuclease